MKPCIRCGVLIKGGARCGACEQDHQRERNRAPGRVGLYTPAWAAESRAIRKAYPYCMKCPATTDLTVDHPTRMVLCRSCHSTMEAQRRAQRRSIVA